MSPGWESLLTAGRPQSAPKKTERRAPAWSGYLRGQGEDTSAGYQGLRSCSEVDTACCKQQTAPRVPKSCQELQGIQCSLLTSGGICRQITYTHKITKSKKQQQLAAGKY